MSENKSILIKPELNVNFNIDEKKYQNIKNNLVVVDEKDNVIGLNSKDNCHENEGILHRAFSVFVFNDKGELLIQKRSKIKKLWPLFWSNTCCSHPKLDESYESAGERRIKEELGIKAQLKFLYKFKYHAKYNKIGSENEICAVLVGKSNRQINPDPKEIADYRWINLEDLMEDIMNNPDRYTPWFKMEIKEVISTYFEKIIKINY